MSKEPGQLACTAYGNIWERAQPIERKLWAHAESTIRADERAKVIEECAMVVDRDIHEMDSEMRSYAKYFASNVRALRAKIGEPNG